MFSSIFILCVSICFNSTCAFLIIIHEISTNQKFHEWFLKYGKIISLITILSSAHLDTMNILVSKFAGLKVLNVEFSEKAKTWLFWGGFINLFIEDVPQFIIQVTKPFSC